ncbi:hypothetical protein KJ693_11985 [bacterium]|nr:hypothetical protein [bacterium]MBU1616012.1 hypothetical protein [bacterium]
MSLKIEQKLDENTFAESKPRIFTTGAFLVPLEIIKNGIKRYVWVVDEFIENTYNDNGIICLPNLYTHSKDYLLQ